MHKQHSKKAGIIPATGADEWDSIITGKSSGIRIDVAELWKYRDLLLMFVKRDIVTVYKQTILGPVWFVLQPVLTTIIFVFVFGNLAGVSTDGVPQILFYLCGVTIWSFFSDTLNVTSKTFVENVGMFGKVYFPRIIMPLSKVVSGIVKFMVQLALFMVFWVYFLIVDNSVAPNIWLLSIPVLIIVMAFIGLGLGLIITSLTTKYRDLTFLVSFGVQLLMYASPVIYPVSTIPEKYRLIVWLNPLSALLETFKYGFLGKGMLDYGWLLYSIVMSILLLAIGIYTFNRVENRFIDTV